MPLPELRKQIKGVTAACINRMKCADACKAFIRMVPEMIAMVVQKRTNVELVSPIQHFLFKPVNTGYGERNKVFVQDAFLANLIIIFLIIEPAVIEEIHVFEFLVDSQIIFVFGLFTATTGTAGLLCF